jgi:hypothetical protein
MFQVCWNRHVIVYNQPDAIDSLEARCPTHPQVALLTDRQRAAHVVEAMNEAQPAMRCDA